MNEIKIEKLKGIKYVLDETYKTYKKNKKKGSIIFHELYEAGEAFDYKITIPEAPASVNHPIDEEEKSAKNRRPTNEQLLRYKKRWEFKIRKLRVLGKIPELTEKIYIKFKFYFDKKRNRDNDNYFMAIKGMTDGLFEEDDSRYVQNSPPDLLIDTKNPRTEILIREIDDEKENNNKEEGKDYKKKGRIRKIPKKGVGQRAKKSKKVRGVSEINGNIKSDNTRKLGSISKNAKSKRKHIKKVGRAS